MPTLTNDPRYRTNRLSHGNVCLTYELFAPAGHHDMDSEHGGIELLFTPGGQGFTEQDMVVRGRKCTLGPSNLLVYNAQETHTELYRRSSDSHLLALVISNVFADDLLSETGVKTSELLFKTIEHPLSPSFREKLSRLFTLREVSGASDLAFDALVSEILLELLETTPHSFSEKLKRASLHGYFPTNIDRAKKEIASRLGDETLGLDDMARAAGLSRFHFLRSFKRRVGVSPAKYVQSLRIELAKAELARGAAVSEAARRSGYTCMSTFNKAFRRQTRLAPSAFRSYKTSV